MSVRWYSVVVDCADVAAQARWWGETLGWPVVYEAADEVVIAPPFMLTDDGEGRTDLPREQLSPGLVFVSVPEGKSVKNRLHIDLSPAPDDDQAAEVERLVARGATRVDVGQDASVGWVVLADPEGNEFCVLSARD